MKKKVIVIVGPTASGKTRTAVKLAKLINGEIISSDSMQVYENMPILTQAPSAEEMEGIPHYFVAEIPPDDEYNAAKFRDSAEIITKKIIERGKIPIITGGTGLYIKALIDGLFPSPGKDVELRRRLEEKAKKYGAGELHKELSRKDPESASNIHPKDIRRIIRALEIFSLTGIPKSVHKKDTRGIGDLYEMIFTGLNIPRKELYERIDVRVRIMFKNGLVGEVERLLARKLSMTARSVLGMKEIREYLKGHLDGKEAEELLKKNTRRYAKRQMTWFRADKRIRWFDCGEGIISYCRSLFQEK